ncbi:MAG: hypothetical protein K2F78_03390, partial [Muribaculaceae bacterium]|nr:hypothetical protein [Muribaculaceae bacterium]
MRHIILLILCISIGLASIAPTAFGQEPAKIAVDVAVSRDTVVPDTAGLDEIKNVKKHKNIIEKIIAYLDDSNKPKKNKKFDFSVIGGPHYSSDTKFGVGLVAAGLY